MATSSCLSIKIFVLYFVAALIISSSRSCAAASGDHEHQQQLLGWIPSRSCCWGTIIDCLAGDKKFGLDSEEFRTHMLRGMWNRKWYRCFIIPWSWTSRMISIYLLCLNFVAEAHDIPYSSFGYACENVQKYYAGVGHLRGEALKRKLNSIIARHQSLSYKEVWDAFKILDAADFDKPEASSEVVEIYSLRVVSKLLAGKPGGWNREHLWPRSYGLINSPSLTDLHNIRPADVNVNSSRGNKFYGECHVNISYCRKPATRESASDTETDKERWTPPEKARGDIARAIMYMAVCYGFNQSGRGLGLQLSDSPSIAKVCEVHHSILYSSMMENPSIDANREMGMLSTLLKWNEVDPPSREEKLRNERVCTMYQHNRNPFVDHPEYANLIWKQVVQGHKGLYTPPQRTMDL